MQRLALSSLALLSLACVLALPLAARTPSKHSASSSHTTTTYADSMQTQHDDRQLRLRSSDHGVVVELAKPSPLIALMIGDVIRSVEGLRIDRVQALNDAVRRNRRKQPRVHRASQWPTPASEPVGQRLGAMDAAGAVNSIADSPVIFAR